MKGVTIAHTTTAAAAFRNVEWPFTTPLCHLREPVRPVLNKRRAAAP